MSKLTIIEKIKNFTWFNLIEQLQDILPNFNKRIEQLETNSTISSSFGEVEEAPLDGNQYGRQDGEWTEISGGSGDIPNLQQVLEKGNITNNPILLQQIPISDRYGTIDHFALHYEADRSIDPTKSDFNANGVMVYKNNSLSNMTSMALTADSLKFSSVQKIHEVNLLGFKYSSQFGSEKTEVTYAVPTVETNLIFPAKAVAGDYTLATTDDLTLQQVLDTGKTAIGKSIELTNTDFGTEHYLTLDGYECIMANLATNKYINFNNTGYYSRDYDTGEIASLSHNEGISIAGVDSGGQTISTKMVKNGIEFRNPNVVTFLKIPNQRTENGTVFNLTMPSKDGILATTEDIPTGTQRQVAGFDADGKATAVTLGWKQLSDLPTPPPFPNGVLTGTAFQEDGSATHGYIELAIDEDSPTSVAKPNTIPLYQAGTIGTGGGTLPVQDPIEDLDAVNKQWFLANSINPSIIPTTLRLKSPNNSIYIVTVSDQGVLATEQEI